LIAETNQSGQMFAEYVYLEDQLLAMIKPGESAYYFHNDHLGTPQILTDGNGNVAWKAVYMPFGGTQILVESVENPFRFPGQYYDQETGLHYNYFRYYNPPIGRYITPDPIGLKGGINLFAYAAGNPANLTDPSGLIMPKGFWTGGGAGGLGMLSGRAIGATIGGAIGAYVGTNIGMEVGFTFGGALGLPAGPLGSFAGGLVGGAIVGAAGGIAGGWIGGQIGGWIGSLFDSPCAGQLNCGEETPPKPSQNKPCS
jgi:RHS repeat-associated protein